jgi:thioesterase domain-containing protein
MFCVHGGAGTILHLAALARRLGDDQPFYGLQSKGLYGGSTPLRSVEEMATHYLAEMREVKPPGPWYLSGYCFGAIVAFEIAQRLVREGEDVELVAIFNGPSPAWIERWGWFGNQPSYLKRHPRPAPAPKDQRRRSRAAALARRAAGTLRNPRKLLTAPMWYLRRPLTRLALATGRPIPEQLREEFFFRLHGRAEVEYKPQVFPGELLVFYGEGLYEDPTLGWDELAAEGVRTYGVPGVHDNNRHAMMEPAVEFVATALQAHQSAMEAHAGA